MKRDESLIPITSAAPVGQQDNEKDTVKVSPGTTRTHSAPSFITQVTQSTQPVYIRPVIDPSAKKGTLFLYICRINRLFFSAKPNNHNHSTISTSSTEKK